MRQDIQMNDDLWYALFPEDNIQEKEPVDYTLTAEERIRQSTVQLFDYNGFAVMEDTQNVEEGSWHNIDISDEALWEKAEPEIKQLFVNNGWGFDGYIPDDVREFYYNRFRENPYWFMTNEEVEDYNVDCNLQLASAYVKYPFVFNQIYSIQDDLEEAIQYRKQKLYKIAEEENFTLDQSTELVRILAEESSLHKDQNAHRVLNYNMQSYSRLLEKAGLGYIVNGRKYAIEQAKEIFFEDIMSPDSASGYSRLKDLEIMMNTANRDLFSSDEAIQEQTESMILSAMQKPSMTYDETLKELTTHYMGLGLPVPDNYVTHSSTRATQDFLLSGLDEEDPTLKEERLRRAEQLAEEERKAREEEMAFRQYEKNRPKTLQDLLGVDFDYDDPESIEIAIEKRNSFLKDQKVKWEWFPDEEKLEMCIPVEEYMSSETIREWYPEEYERLKEKGKIIIARSELLEEMEEEERALATYEKETGKKLDPEVSLKTIKNGVIREVERQMLHDKYFEDEGPEGQEYRSGVKYPKIKNLYDSILDEFDMAPEEEEEDEDINTDIDTSDMDYYFELEKRRHLGEEEYRREREREAKTHTPIGRKLPGVDTDELLFDHEMLEEAYRATRDSLIATNEAARKYMMSTRTDRDPNAVGFAGNPYPMDPFEEDIPHKKEYEYYSNKTLTDEKYKDGKYISLMDAGMPAETIVTQLMKPEEKERILKEIGKQRGEMFIDYDPRGLDDDATEEELREDDISTKGVIDRFKDDLPPVEEHALQVIKYLEREYGTYCRETGTNPAGQKTLQEIVAKRRGY